MGDRLNYDPEEREEGIKLLDSGHKLRTNENGEYILTFSFNIKDYHGVAPYERATEAWSEAIDKASVTNREVIEAHMDVFAQTSSFANVKFEPFDPDKHEKADLVIVQASIVDEPEEGVTTGKAVFPKQGAQNSQQYIIYRADHISNISDPDVAPYDRAYAFHTVIHEVGHTLGLKHPHDNKSASGNADPPTYNFNSTAMAYSDQRGVPSKFSSFDIAGLKKKYGPNENNNAGDTVYKIDPMKRDIYTIEDGGKGEKYGDTLDASAAKKRVKIDLMEGPKHSSSIGEQTIQLAYGANIENAIGGEGGDNIKGNRLDNRLTGNGGVNAFIMSDGGKTDDLGNDVITDFEFRSNLIRTGGDVAGVDVYISQHNKNAVLIFKDANGKIIPGTSLTLESFMVGALVDGVDDEGDLRGVYIFREGAAGLLSRDAINIIEGPAPNISSPGPLVEDRKGDLTANFVPKAHADLASLATLEEPKLDSVPVQTHAVPPVISG